MFVALEFFNSDCFINSFFYCFVFFAGVVPLVSFKLLPDNFSVEPGSAWNCSLTDPLELTCLYLEIATSKYTTQNDSYLIVLTMTS